MSRILRMFKQAEREAERSIHQHPVGCIIAKGSNIIARGHNQVRYKGRGKRFTNYAESLHAERDATSKVSKEYIQGATAYVYRKGKRGTARLSKPCEHCRKLFELLGIKTVYYTDPENPAGYGELRL